MVTGAPRNAAVLCTFNVDGQNDRAACEYVDETGRVYDSWTMRSFLNTTQPIPARGAKTKCPAPSLEEYAVVGELDDAIELLGGEVVCGRDALDAAEGTVALRFESVDIDASDLDGIEHVYLQVYGYATAELASDISIRAELGASAPLQCNRQFGLSSRPTTQATAHWTHFEDDAAGWEMHEVWVSVDIKDVVAEAVSQPNWKRGSALTTFLSAEGGARSFFAREMGVCTTPHLSITRATSC